MKHCAKFWIQSVKNFQSFQTSGPEGPPLKKFIRTRLLKKYITRTLMCSNATLCQTLSNWQRIFGDLRF